MKNSIRLYRCARCHCKVVICSDCDRNNIYCSESCSQDARLQCCRLSNQRYQQSLKGRLKHALRQRRYRARIKKVTDHTSSFTPSNDLLFPEPRPSLLARDRCHFCGEPCSEFYRTGFLRDYSEHRQRLSAWPLAP
jgi:hypothetical protein